MYGVFCYIHCRWIINMDCTPVNFSKHQKKRINRKGTKTNQWHNQSYSSCSKNYCIRTKKVPIFLTLEDSKVAALQNMNCKHISLRSNLCVSIKWMDGLQHHDEIIMFSVEALRKWSSDWVDLILLVVFQHIQKWFQFLQFDL